MTPFSSLIFVGWLANPILLVGLWCLWKGKYQIATHCGLIASMIGICWWLGKQGYLLLPPEFDRVTDEYEFRHGYWLWLSSFVMLTVSSICLYTVRTGRTSDAKAA